MTRQNDPFENLGLSITGIGVEYPPHNLGSDTLRTVAQRFYPDSPAMSKILSINDSTGIDFRSAVVTVDTPLINQKKPPTATDIHEAFISEGVPLAIAAARQAMNEAHLDPEDITHVVSTTCTDSANPGFDHLVISALGLSDRVEKVLLHGVGCSGGLAVLRTAANLALGHTARRKPARILCVALEVCTTLVRSELNRVNDRQEIRIGATLFSDCGSALILSNDVGAQQTTPIYELHGWDHRTIPDTSDLLRFDVDPMGFKVTLTPKVPKMTTATIFPAFSDLLSLIPQAKISQKSAQDFDWAIHPGGANILAGAKDALGITQKHLRASRDIYANHGNSSSTTIMSVLDRLRDEDMDVQAPGGRPKEYVVGCAFGPGMVVETCLLRRPQRERSNGNGALRKASIRLA